MNSITALVFGLSLLVVGSGCQHAAAPSLKMQQQFFSSLKNSNPEEERALRSAQYYQLVGRFDLALKELSTCHGLRSEQYQTPQYYGKLLRPVGGVCQGPGDV